MAAKELIERGRAVALDERGNAIATRVYWVQGVLPEDVHWGTDGLPNYFAQYPTRTQSVALELKATEFGDNASALVEITYRTPDDSATWSITHQTVSVDVPMIFAKALSTTVNGDATATKVWENSIDKTQETRAVLQARWLVFEPSINDVYTIANEHNKIHTLPNEKKYLFQSGGMRPMSPFVNPQSGETGVVYEMQGSWISDLGTKQISSPPADQLLFQLPGNLEYAGTLPPGFEAGVDMRPPFYELRLLPALEPAWPDVNTPGERSKVRLRQLYTESGTIEEGGWRNLPGSALLAVLFEP